MDKKIIEESHTQETNNKTCNIRHPGVRRKNSASATQSKTGGFRHFIVKSNAVET